MHVAQPRGRSRGPAGSGMQTYERHTADLARAMIEILEPMLPTDREYKIKEATRRQLEQLAAHVCPGARLLAFGSMANGFALRNSETDFQVLPLPKARIPIIKISRRATSEVPCDIACDIGFDNQVALENTRLLLSYAMIDPARIRPLVLFLKVWTKRRKLNSPYTGTLSSYGYTLLVLFYLIHVRRPNVLPNLQRIPPGRPLAPEEAKRDGCNVYFYDDIDTLRREWHSLCTDSIGELMLDFFRYFSRDFNYAKDAISIHTEAGLVTKESRGWSGEHLCIEDPFQHGYNVSRTVTKDGLYTIRGEFMRAGRLLSNRSARARALLDELCEEREDSLTRAPDFPSSRRHHETPTGPREPFGASGAVSFDDSNKHLGAAAMQGVTYPPNPAMFAPSTSAPGMLRGAAPERAPRAEPGPAALMPFGMMMPPRMTPMIPPYTPMPMLSARSVPVSPAAARGTATAPDEDESDAPSPASSAAAPPDVARGMQSLSLETQVPQRAGAQALSVHTTTLPPSEAEGEMFRHDAYYARAREFRAWLEERDHYLDEMPSEDARRYFARFVRRWNDGRLSDRYYAGAAAPVQGTRYRWRFKEEGAARRSVSPPRYGMRPRSASPVRPVQDPASAPRTDAPRSAADRQYEREVAQEEARRAAQRVRRAERREAKEWAEEQAPRATGRDAVRERRREVAASNRAMAERREIDDDVGDTMSTDALLGLGDSFQDALAERDRQVQRRQGRQEARAAERAAARNERVAALQSKEAATMAMLRSMAQQRFT
ncbi:RNA uridylyltransferase [Malassezia brasiliensis]|uniref:polynucleotide adenylyltransferase n=1 Tax=Malassezia brasiliensis TaxID=1821822 RepID=A0AAF0DRU9_9BASI|nr:RNA uridylyltransferase [Malassezia brasiliensis]